MKAVDLLNKPKMKWLIIGYIVIMLVIIAITLGVYATQKNEKSINSFQECADAGYPIQESFPETCAAPNGKSFTKPQ